MFLKDRRIWTWNTTCFSGHQGMKKKQNGRGYKLDIHSIQWTPNNKVCWLLRNRQVRHTNIWNKLRKGNQKLWRRNKINTAEASRTLISWLEDSLAKHFQSPVKSWIWTPEVRSYLMSLGFSETKIRYFILENVKGLLSHDSWKTFSLLYQNSHRHRVWRFMGIHNSRTMVSHKTENVSTLSEILEENPDPKYFPEEHPRQDIVYDVKGSQRPCLQQEGLAPTIPQYRGGNTHPKVFSFKS